MKNAYPQLLEKKKIILNELKIEESRFLETLERGEKLLAEITAHECDLISGEQAFELYDTYGFPLELTEEIANEKGISVDIMVLRTRWQSNVNVLKMLLSVLI